MRTTIDIPEDLLRQAKATAALRGIKLKDLIAELMRLGLAQPYRKSVAPMGMNCPIPVTIPATVLTLKPLSNAQVETIFMQEDLEKIDID
jgi:hypothetical protein